MVTKQCRTTAKDNLISSGDLVLVQIYEINSKLAPRFKGPHRILQQVRGNKTKVSYEVKVVHLDHVKRGSVLFLQNCPLLSLLIFLPKRCIVRISVLSRGHTPLSKPQWYLLFLTKPHVTHHFISYDFFLVQRFAFFLSSP